MDYAVNDIWTTYVWQNKVRFLFHIYFKHNPSILNS